MNCRCFLATVKPTGPRRPSRKRLCPRPEAPRFPGKVAGRGRTHHGYEGGGRAPVPAGKTNVSVDGARGPGANPASLPRFPPKCRPHGTPSSSPTRSTQHGGPQIPPGRGLPRINPLFPASRPRDTHSKRQEARTTIKNETSVSGQLNPPPGKTGYGVRKGSRMM